VGGGASALHADDDPRLEIEPGNGSGVRVEASGPGAYKLYLSRDRDFLRPTGTLGNAELGEMSPVNLDAYAFEMIELRLHAGGGPIRTYAVRIRVLSPQTVPPGNLAPADVGMGVVSINSCNETANPLFAVDPRTAPKNVDGIPLFVGTLGDCVGSSVELFRTNCQGNKKVHRFTLVWAVAPQFFTPQSNVAIEVLLELEVL